MSEFRRYDHLERLGHPEVAGLIGGPGRVYVFPKLDGTNASVWAAPHEDDGYRVRAGSRNRVLSAGSDNHGFCAWVEQNDELNMLALAHPNWIFYGEWLVPHSLRTYREAAWRKFYVFDVFDCGAFRYLPFEVYAAAVREAGEGVDLIEPLCVLEDPSEEQLRTMCESNTYLIRDGEGAGEGVVLKRYNWCNQFGRQPWAKLVRSEFKEANARIFGLPHVAGEKQVEQEIVDEFATEAWIRKEFDRVVEATAEDSGVPAQHLVLVSARDAFVAANRHKIIPRTLGTLFNVFINENAWAMVKQFKNPVVDFGKLNRLLTIRIKQVLTEVF